MDGYMCIFCSECGMQKNRCCEHQCMCRCVRYTGLLTWVYTFACTLTTGCAHALMYAQFVHQHWGTRLGGSASPWRPLVAWCGRLILTEGETRVLSVSSLILTRVGVYVDVCVCMRTRTHTLHMGYSGVSPGVGKDTWRAQRRQMESISAYLYSYMCAKYTRA